MVPVDVLRGELPEVEVFAKMECLNPGGSLKDRPVLPDPGGRVAALDADEVHAYSFRQDGE